MSFQLFVNLQGIKVGDVLPDERLASVSKEAFVQNSIHTLLLFNEQILLLLGSGCVGWIQNIIHVLSPSLVFKGPVPLVKVDFDLEKREHCRVTLDALAEQVGWQILGQ